MSDNRAQASRYAQAVLQAMLERWQSSLAEAAALLTTDKKLAAALSKASASAADKVAALEAALPAGMPAEIRNLLKLMLQEGELDLIPDVSSALVQQVSGQRAPLQADIVSAIELSAGDQEKLRKMLTQQHGEGLVFRFSVDPSLLGGLRVRVGDRLTDTSVASRLAALRESLSAVAR
jgi:F-type H+-transporting ATPase subunit delta